MKRSPEGGYGYTGVSVKKDGQTWYQMSDRGGQFFLVNADWNSPGGTSLSFWETHFGNDLQSAFPILQNQEKRKALGDAAFNIIETFFLEKLIRWPLPLPVYIPKEYYNDQGGMPNIKN